LGVDPVSGIIRVASENAHEWLGAPLSAAGGSALEAAVRTGSALDPVVVSLDGHDFDTIVTRLNTLTLVEFEPASARFDYARTSVVGALQRLSVIRDPAELRAEAAREVRAITGFDRVMVYAFHEDGHGEVVAEDRDPEMEPYLGLHFPASDIPPQARALYLSKLSRAIVSTSDPGSPLLTLEGDPMEVDLSQSELRSVSPYHLQFMRNMGQASTVSFSLISEDRLVGMITCAHRTERRLPALLRRALEVLTTQLSVQHASLEEIERLRHTVAVREQRTELLAPLFASNDLAEVLLESERSVLDLVSADGVAVRIDGVIRSAGRVPGDEGLEAAFHGTAGTSWATECLGVDRPALAALLPGFAGLLAVPLGSDDALMFFRHEVTRVVSWLGDQGQANRADSLSPRLSYSSWQQAVRGTSLPWGTLVEEAAELSRELQGALRRQTEVRLAVLAMRDPLSGLHNRRFLAHRLADLAEREEPVAMLFLDLDRFKNINDAHGHEVGDAVLVETGRRLSDAAGASDDVIRLGGDEFVVLCSGIHADAVESMAERMVDALRAPITVGDRTLTVTASCGIVLPGAAGATLLEQADAAMYRAKRQGRDRVSR
jgi:diguanylate cyclase (GGDEF)-like protein